MMCGMFGGKECEGQNECHTFRFLNISHKRTTKEGEMAYLESEVQCRIGGAERSRMVGGMGREDIYKAQYPYEM